MSVSYSAVSRLNVNFWTPILKPTRYFVPYFMFIARILIIKRYAVIRLVFWGWEMAVFRFWFRFHCDFLRIDYYIAQKWKFSGWDFCFSISHYVPVSFSVYQSFCLSDCFFFFSFKLLVPSNEIIICYQVNFLFF